jgi:sugar/nucleoside kinase (ribokinase family)
MASSLPELLIEQISRSRGRLARAKVLVGLDGFVDTIIHVVGQRESAQKYTRMGRMSDFGQRIGAAAGLSANFEFVTKMVKLGGNGPIMAHALASQGPRVTYIGNLGSPALHPVFSDLAKQAKVISIAEPGYTDEIEFEDGKLMCGKHESLRNVNWETLIEHVPEKRLIAMFQESSLIALVNWTMLPFLGAIWAKIQSRVAPKLTGEKRWLFLDLADPAKRTPADIAAALKTIARFQKYFRVILGLNLQEGRQIGAILGLPACDGSEAKVAALAGGILEKLGVDTVVIHPTAFAAAADATGCASVAGPYIEKPKITTGAGDHFNAGFCTARLLGCDLQASLQMGVATSGYYVRKAKSPSLDELIRFLKTL